MFEYLSVIQQYSLEGKVKFFLRGRHCGFIKQAHAALLQQEHPSFFNQTPAGLALLPTESNAITDALQQGYITILASGGTVINSPDEYMALSLDLDPARPDARRSRRNNFFGIPYFGVHVNIFSRIGNDVRIWLSRRSQAVFTYQGCWDVAAGGSVSYGHTAISAARKEAYEEAGLPDQLLQPMKLAAIVDQSFDSLYTHGLHLDHQYYFDLEVPADFIPTPVDGEAEGCISLSAEEAWVVLQDGVNWKHNAAITVLDFGLRHGLYTPPKDVREHIMRCLHQPLPLDDAPANWPLDDLAA